MLSQRVGASCSPHLSARNQTWTRSPGTFCATSKCSFQRLLCWEDVSPPGGPSLAFVIKQSRGSFLFRQCLGANVSTMPTKCNSSPPLNTYLKRCCTNAGNAVHKLHRLSNKVLLLNKMWVHTLPQCWLEEHGSRTFVWASIVSPHYCPLCATMGMSSVVHLGRFPSDDWCQFFAREEPRQCLFLQRVL